MGWLFGIDGSGSCKVQKLQTLRDTLVHQPAGCAIGADLLPL